MIGAFHKKRLSIARIREAAATDRNGTSLAGLFEAAKAIGFSARAVKATAESIGKLSLPAIAHWREDNRSHFVVVYKVTPRRVVIGDPSVGLRKLDRDRFNEHWTGVLLLVSTNPGVRAHVRSGQLISLLLPHRRLFLDALLAAVLMTILGLTSSFFIQALVDFVFVLEQSPALNLLSLGMLVVLLARVGFQTLRTYLLAHLSLRIDADTVMGFHRHLLGLPLSFFARRKTGEILSRMNDAIKIRTAVTTATLCMIVDGVLVSVTATVMLWVHWKLALIALGAMPALAAIIWWTNRSMKSCQQQAIERAAEVESCVVETLGAMQLVKASRAETRMQLRTEARFSEMLEATYRAQLIGMRTSAATIIVSGVSSLAVLCFGGHEVLAGSLTVGQLMGFHTLLAAILTPIERLASVNQPVLDAIIAAERLGEVFELDGEVSAQRKDPLDRPLAGAIDFEDVTCRYGSDRPIFEHVSFKIARGECIGVTGASGCGKTTVVNLLTRFLEPSAGRITLDNVPLTDYALDCIRRDIAVVPQDIVLLHASIADNIRLGLPSATAVQIHAAGETARLDKLVARLPMGYDTVVGERGLTLSGGERQRVAIARAILSNPPILVMDEPTSHLDAESAMAVDQIISSRRGIQTTVVISHRPIPVDRYISLGEHTSNRLSQMQSA